MLFSGDFLDFPSTIQSVLFSTFSFVSVFSFLPKVNLFTFEIFPETENFEFIL